MPLPKQIKTVSANVIQKTEYPGGSRQSYECANPFITRGVTNAPRSYEECINTSLYNTSVLDIVNKIGGFPSWSGPPAISGTPTTIPSTLIGLESPECAAIPGVMGSSEWKGCFWSASDSIFSCDCPSIGSKYPNYVKLRLNAATFWNTKRETPVIRKKFLDAITYGKKITFVIAGDFTIRPGAIVNIYADAISGYSIDITNSILSKKYYVISVKNTATNSGVQETAVTAVELLY
jgi:hypothetical protein